MAESESARLFGSPLRFKVMSWKIQVSISRELAMTILRHARCTAACIMALLCGELASPALAHEGHHHPDPRAFGGIMPQLSPDGETLAFSYQGAIWKMARTGGVMKRLTKERGLDIEPAWSPDGKKIAYISTKGFSAGNLRLVSAAGDNIPPPQDMTVMDKLHFDPKGERILGLFQPANEKIRLAWYSLATGELTPAVDEKTWPGHALGAPGLARQRPTLSHDGKWLAVNTVADMPDEQGGNNGPQNEIWKVPLLGAHGGNIPKPQLIARWPARIHEMCWRADDKAVLVVTERGGVHNDIWEVPLENGEVTAKKLTFGQADEDSPSFSADGKWLAYSENRFGATMFVVRNLETLDEQIVRPGKFNWSKNDGDVTIQIAEGPQNTIIPARIVIQEDDGKFVAPAGSLYRMLNGELHFYTTGDFHLELPSSVYTLKVFRGLEYKPEVTKFSITTAEVTGVHVPLERWTNQAADGWFGGENHIHANYGYGQWYNSPATMLEQISGEDLTVANFMVANSDSDGVFDREFFLGRPDPVSTDAHVLYWNQEFRATIWGHMTLLNLKQLVTPIFTGFKNTTHPYDFPTNAHIADHTHEQKGLVNYTHPAHSLQDPYATAYSAKEMPVDVALGKIDTLDVMGSNHQATYPVWYRLLNCGLKIPASAGTDVFLNRINSRLPGSDRVYVHCGVGKFSYQNWIDNLRAGKSFVTNGPMLRFTAAGQEPGATLKLDKPGKLRVQGEVTSQYPLEKLELVLTGKPLVTIPASAESLLRITIDQEIDILASGWLALRARGPRGEHQAASESFAHTSPIYVEVKDQPLKSPEDAKYFVSWIDRLRTDVRKRNRIPEGQQAVVEKQLAEAMEFYKKQAE